MAALLALVGFTAFFAEGLAAVSCMPAGSSTAGASELAEHEGVAGRLLVGAEGAVAGRGRAIGEAGLTSEMLLRKPFTTAHLVASLRRALGQSDPGPSPRA